MKHVLPVFAALCLLAVPTIALADGEGDAEPAEGPPLPLHQFEGSGGAFTTLQAYIVNPALPGRTFGNPSFGYIHVHLGNGKHLESLTVTEAITDRIELGYGFNYLDMGDLPEDIERAFGDTVKVGDDAISMHTFNARFQLITEGSFDYKYTPAVTFGAHYKVNTTIEDVDDDLGGALEALDIEDDKGVDLTLVATKYLDFEFLPVPVCFSAAVRWTEAAHVGFLGFTGDRRFVAEVGMCSPIADNFWVAFEYKQKPYTYDDVPGLLEDEDDWWTIDVAYIPNNNMTVSLGYGHFGKVLNHRANKSFGIAVKYEF
jgi:hypothetical protein